MSHSIVFRRLQKSSKKTRRQKPRQPKIVSMRESACSSLVQDFVRYLFGSECQGIKAYSIIIIFFRIIFKLLNRCHFLDLTNLKSYHNMILSYYVVREEPAFIIIQIQVRSFSLLSKLTSNSMIFA